ncbi:hypothetical protein TNCV_2723761 [Trichonephila clavipes]|nr:hypothetical protein TNCV_2723761 [Trichonephila clavipes]
MIMRHVKDPWNACLAWVLLAKLSCSISLRQSSGAFLLEGNWASKLHCQLVSTYMVPYQKVILAPGECSRSAMVITNPHTHLIEKKL